MSIVFASMALFDYDDKLQVSSESNFMTAVVSASPGSEEKPEDKVSRPRKLNLHDDWWIYAILVLFVIISVIMITRHEPWLDETKAWVMAGHSNPWTLILTELRYEGHPALWYLLLMIPARLHFPLLTLNILSICIATASVYVFMKYSPFPVWVKVIFPFTFFILYQYGIIARSYVLIPLILFLLATIYPKKEKKTFAFVFLLCLLANVSLHGTLIAIAIYIVYSIDIAKSWKSMERTRRERQVYSGLIFLLVLVFVVLQLFPPKDGASAIGWIFSLRYTLRIFSNAIEVASCVWLLPVAIVLLVVSLIWFWRQKTLLLYILPTAMLLALFATKNYSYHHAGVLFFVWLFCMWVSFQRDSSQQRDPVPTLKAMLSFRTAALACLGVVLLLQLHWSVEAISSDYKDQYSGSYLMAKTIKANHLESSDIFYIGGGWSTITAYFNRNIFTNIKDRGVFERLNIKNSASQNVYAKLDSISIAQISKQKPEFVVDCEIYHAGLDNKLSGYKLVAVYPGLTDLGGRIGPQDEFILFQRKGSRRKLSIGTPH